jgi:hypothetical protein
MAEVSMLANASVSRDYVAGIPAGSSGPACDMLDDLFSVDRFTADVNIALSRLGSGPIDVRRAI